MPHLTVIVDYYRRESYEGILIAQNGGSVASA